MSAAVALPLLVLLVGYGPTWLFAATVCLLALAGLYEYFTLAFSSSTFSVAFGLAWGGAVLAGMVSRRAEAVAAVMASGLLGGFLYVLFRGHDLDEGVAWVGRWLVGVVYVGALFPYFIWLREVDARWLLFTLLVVMMGDTGAYIAGRRWGRHKLLARVSPGKTWEGGVGGVVSGLLGAAVARALFLPPRPPAEVFVLAFFLCILGQVGDLCESAMKRAFGAKEAGWLVPGHGGILDRTDSLLFPVAAVYHYLKSWG